MLTDKIWIIDKEQIPVINVDSHIYLYAKGWYKKTNVIEDLKVLYGKRNGIDSEYISVNHILCCLTKLAFSHMTGVCKIGEFISDISPDNAWRIWKFGDDEWDYWKAVISKCLSILALTEVKDIPFVLAEPDYSLLPKSEKV
jgi:hypothetical protein